jgi:hypothetical protein
MVVVHSPPLGRERPPTERTDPSLEIQEFLVLPRRETVGRLDASVVGSVTGRRLEGAVVF